MPLLFLIIFLFSSIGTAVESDLPPLLTNTRGKPYPEYIPPTTAEKMEDETNPNKPLWPWSLPIWGQKVLDKGIQLPRPYGLGLVFYHQEQAINIHDLEVAFGNEDLRPIDFIDFGHTKVDNTTWQLKLDAWVLPFLNVFGIFGAIKGTGEVPISIASKDVYEYFIPGICSGGSPPNFCNGYISAVAPIDYHGNNVGIGILIAGAYKNFFFAMPATYVVTDINVSDTNITAVNVTPRIGYSIVTNFNGKFGPYIGANYLDAKGYLTGTYTLPLAGTPIGRDVEVRYKLRESPVDKWNFMFGMNWQLSDLWSIAAEVGISKNRTSQTFNFGYRF